MAISSNFHFAVDPTSAQQLKSRLHLLQSNAGPMLGGEGKIQQQYAPKSTPAYTMTHCPASAKSLQIPRH